VALIGHDCVPESNDYVSHVGNQGIPLADQNLGHIGQQQTLKRNRILSEIYTVKIWTENWASLNILI
jgi:hypothetical protein